MLTIFTLRDAKGEHYFTPFFKKTEGEALRDLQTMVNSTEPNNISRYPEDFDLYKIGTFNEQDGKIESIVPVHIKHALDLKEVQ